MKQIDVAIAVIHRAGSVLICQRRQTDSFGGLWEFPGGKVEPGETIERALSRELHEELGVAVRIDGALTAITHTYPNARVRLHPYWCELTEGEPRPLASQGLKWVTAAELATHAFPPANDGLLREVAERMRASAATALR